jgi:hypothetical protein
VLDMAFMGEGRLLVLSEDDLLLYRWSEGGLLLAARRRLAGPLEPVRHAGGLLRAVEREHAAWAATSRTSGALLFAVEEGALVERQRADACLARLRAGCASGQHRPDRGTVEAWARPFCTSTGAWLSIVTGGC